MRIRDCSQIMSTAKEGKGLSQELEKGLILGWGHDPSEMQESGFRGRLAASQARSGDLLVSDATSNSPITQSPKLLDKTNIKGSKKKVLKPSGACGHHMLSTSDCRAPVTLKDI